MTIRIENLSFEAILGIHESERRKRQNITVSLAVKYKYIDENSFVDYAEIVQLTKNHIQEMHYKLLEDAVAGLKFLLLEHYPLIKELFIKITKPDILPDCNVSISDKWP